MADLSFLLTRDYADKSALALVGDRYQLTKRQRMLVLRASCPDQALPRRRASSIALDQISGLPLFVDGLNILITIECALMGAVVFKGRDGVIRDIAGVHGTFRKGKMTSRAVELMLNNLTRFHPEKIHIYLDAPVSNSGRLKHLIQTSAASFEATVSVSLVMNPDQHLVDCQGVAVTSDAWILDNTPRWTNLIDAMFDMKIFAPEALMSFHDPDAPDAPNPIA